MPLRYWSVFLLAGFSTVAWAQEPTSKPNVLIVLTDDQGMGDFSYTGNPILKTPNLDQFAKQSVRLTDFHVAPMCSPTRGQLMTGVAALRNGVTSVTAGRTFLRSGIPTLPEVFAKAGYRTGIFGKWHLGDHYPHRPMDKGFQEAIYHLGWGQLHSTPEFDRPLIDGRYFHNGMEKQYKGHCTDVWFDAAMNWMKECKAKNEPFFCYLPTNAPHAPHIDLDEFTKPYAGVEAGDFFGMIAHIDKRFGDMEKFLDDHQLKNNTIVIFMTDNGGTAGVKTFNAGLRGGKTSYYEGGHRVPCWIRWPNGKLGEPRDVTVPTQVMDIFPTLCDWCGVENPPREKEMEPYLGISLAKFLRGEEKGIPDRILIVQYGQTPKKLECCVIRGKWRWVNGKELYDMEADPAQTVNLVGVHPGVIGPMRQYYHAWWGGVKELLTEFVPISIGSKKQPMVELTSADWEGIYADNTGFVREAVGGSTGGHWHIQVETAGEYEFTLRRWPKISGAMLGDRYDPSPKSPPNKSKINTRSFPKIAKAHMEIADVKVFTEADPKAPAVVLKVKLPAGRTTLKAWFADAQNNNLCGAFFVDVRKLDE